MTPLSATLGALILLVNGAAWVAFRWDKRAAAKKSRRVPERRLMTFAALDPFGALLAMYGHAKRHKVRKRLFTLGVPTFAVLQGALGAVAAAWAFGLLP